MPSLSKFEMFLLGIFVLVYCVSFHRCARRVSFGSSEKNSQTLYEKARKLDSSNALPHERSEAICALVTASEQGQAWAQYQVAEHYATSEGAARHYEKAVKLYRKAAEQGHAAAQYRLGFCYENNLGVAKDDALAVEWYRKAARNGNADAAAKLRELGHE